jgi:catechol 2,3-dioxygenase-like lactoylglutathione lyase family enzyme
MDILFVAGFASIVPDPQAGRAFYKDTLGLPLEVVSGDYLAVDGFAGSKHLGVWPLADAAESCFGSRQWPADVPVPQATLEFEVVDVPAAAAELESSGYTLIHGARTEPWGQVIARLLGPEGLLIGVCWTPWLNAPQDESSSGDKIRGGPSG